MELGQKIRRLRGTTSRDEVASEVGCSKTTILHIESGRRAGPSVWTIAALANLFDVPLDWLVDEDADFPPPAEDDRQKATALVADALAGAGLVGELSPEEFRLVAAFRKLSVADQIRLEGVVWGMSREPLTAEGAADCDRGGSDQVAASRRADSRRHDGVGEKCGVGT